MNETVVGKVKNIHYQPEEDLLEVTIIILDKKFQKKLLRDLDLAGKIKFEQDKLIYQDTTEDL